MNDQTRGESPAEQGVTKSKTAIKKEMLARQELGAALVKLNDSQLAQIPLDESLRDSIIQARTIRQREAHRRQLQYIGKLMRRVDYDLINLAYQKLLDNSKHHIQRQHQAEAWRDRLLQENNSAVKAFVLQFPGVDIQYLRQMIRAALKEQQQGTPPAQARKLFRYIRELL